MTASLHPRLAQDTLPVGETADYWLRCMNDQRFAWLVVVPKKDGLREWHHLPDQEQVALLAVVNQLAAQLETLTGADKMNIGALGNVVPQLHVHIIARFQGDPCWPGPVWGQGEVEPWPNGAVPPWLSGLALPN